MFKKKKHVLFFPPVVVFPPACGQQAGDAAAPPEERGEASGADGGVCSHQTSRRIPEGGEMETTGDRRRVSVAAHRSVSLKTLCFSF